MALLYVSGASDYFQLNNINVRRLDFSDSNVMLNGCEVGELNAGIGTAYQYQKEKKDLSTLSGLKSDIRDSTVNRAKFFVPHAMVNVQRSTVERLLVEVSACRIDQLDLRDNSSVERMTLSGAIGKVKLRTSKVSDLEFAPGARLTDLDMTSSYIYRAHNCHPETVVNKSSDTWRLVMDFAQLENNATLYAKAGYEYMKSERRELKGVFSRMAYRVIELTCGYGYRPLNTVLMSLLVCFGCGVAFWYLSIDYNAGVQVTGATGKMDPLELFGYSIYYSVVTFTTVGYGDVLATGPIARALACFEALAGISLSSLFIFALTKRYGGLR